MDAEVHAPPPHPPPLLTRAQVEDLARQGHLPVALPPALLDALEVLFAASASFFSNPETLKTASYPAGQGTELGYYHIPSEKEYLTLRSQSGLQHPIVEPAQRAWQSINSLLSRVLSDISHGLDIPFSAWEPMVAGVRTMPESVEDSSPSLMRLFNYFPTSGVAGAHRDNGLLTICVGDGRGLEVWEVGDEGRGSWVGAQGPTVLVGDTLRLLSFDRVKSGLHRVVGNEKGRASIVFALRASLTLDVDLAEFGAEGTVNMGSLWKEINASKVNVNAQRDIRDEQTKKRQARLAASGVPGQG